MAISTAIDLNRRMDNRPIVRRTIIVMIAFLGIAMVGMVALGVALYRT